MSRPNILIIVTGQEYAHQSLLAALDGNWTAPPVVRKV